MSSLQSLSTAEPWETWMNPTGREPNGWCSAWVEKTRNIRLSHIKPQHDAVFDISVQHILTYEDSNCPDSLKIQMPHTPDPALVPPVETGESIQHLYLYLLG